jgi:hypothetical protein
MTDMRATERLLEVLAQNMDTIEVVQRITVGQMAEMTDAIAELRRRGGTLVRGRDVELVIQALAREQIGLGEDEAQALNRLDGALGGVL